MEQTKDKIAMVPFVTLESERVMHDREKHRWFIIVLVLLILLVGSNAAWLVYESQYVDEVVTQEVTQEADGGNNSFVGGDYYGETNG